MTWYLWLLIGFAAGSIYGTLMTHYLFHHRSSHPTRTDRT